MANVARVRVELRDCSPNASREERDRAFRSMFSVFKRQVNEAGIISLWKEKQYYESPGERKRRKRKENAAEREKEKLRDYFGNSNGKRDR